MTYYTARLNDAMNLNVNLGNIIDYKRPRFYYEIFTDKLFTTAQ